MLLAALTLKTILIINPTAGPDQGTAFASHIAERLRSRFGTVDVALTTARGDGTRAAREAVAAGYDCVIAGGGDGTLNEVLNGAVQNDGACDEVLLGIVPLGTGNDFARALGITMPIDRAVDALLSATERRVDAGRLNGRWFINTSAGGFIAEASDSTNEALKTAAGRVAYLVGGAQALWSFDPVKIELHFPNGVERVTSSTQSAASSTDFTRLEMYAFAVCNAPTIGGGRLIAPYAQIADGQLDLCLIESSSALEFVNVLRKLSAGEHLSDARVAYYHAQRMDFSFSRTIKVNTDGEMEETSACSYEVRPGALRFLATS